MVTHVQVSVEQVHADIMRVIEQVKRLRLLIDHALNSGDGEITEGMLHVVRTLHSDAIEAAVHIDPLLPAQCPFAHH